MGSRLSSFINSQVRDDENHRVLGIDDTSEMTCVDGTQDFTNQTEELLKWCQNSQKNGFSLLKRNFVEIPAVEKRLTVLRNRYTFRIMQWNTLADALGSGKDNFIKCPREAMIWEQRKLQILEEMLTYSPDIICCQEVDHFSDFFNVELSKVGYRGAFLPKTYSPCLDVQPNNGPDGCAIFFKSEKFELIKCKAISLKTLSIWSNHVALFHLLRFKKSSENEQTNHEEEGMFLIGTTHLKAKAGHECMRESQGKDILRFLEQYAESEIPVILCGDFNAKPEEAVYKLMRTGTFPVFESAYTLLRQDENEITEPLFTTWCIRPTGENRKTVDYIFYSRDDFTVHALLELPTSEAIGPCRLPSSSYPSDHLSLVCDFELLPKHQKIPKLSPKI